MKERFHFLMFSLFLIMTLNCGIFEPKNKTPKDGTWEGSNVKFIVENKGKKVTYFYIEVPRYGLGLDKRTNADIKDGSFAIKYFPNVSPESYSFKGTVNGNFKSSEEAEVKFDIEVRRWSGPDGPSVKGKWTAKWKNSSTNP